MRSPVSCRCFPTSALIALLVIGAKGDSAGFRETCIADAKTIPAYLAFLGVCHLTAGRVPDRHRHWAHRWARRRTFHLPGTAQALTTILNHWQP